MIFSIANIQFEALQLDTTAQRQSCTMVRLPLAILDLHLTRTSEVVTSRDIELCAQQQIATNSQVFDESLIPVIQTRQSGRKPEG